MTYDDWKTRSDRDETPHYPDWYCEKCGHHGWDADDSCGCPCCTEPDEPISEV